MSVTYTENLQLGLQTDKNDYLDWDVITENWRKIDSAASGKGGGIPVTTAYVQAQGVARAVVGTAQVVPLNKWNYWQETNDDSKESATLTAKPTANCLLVAAVMHRNENVTIDGSGWTLVQKSVEAVNETGDINQWISVWTKLAYAGTYEVTVQQESSVRMSLKVAALYGAVSLTAVENLAIPEKTYRPPEKTGKRRLYMISSISANSSAQTYTASDYGDLDLRSAFELRFMLWYDYEPNIDNTPLFTYYTSYTAKTANALTLDIEEGE